MTPYRRRRQMYLGAVWLMPVAVLSQIGLALFGVPLAIHGILGAIIGIIALLLICLAQFANTSRSQRILAFALVGLIALQPCFVGLRTTLSALAAVHAINAFVIFGLASALALDSEDTETCCRAQPGMASPDGWRPAATESDRSVDCRRLKI